MFYVCFLYFHFAKSQLGDKTVRALKPTKNNKKIEISIRLISKWFRYFWKCIHIAKCFTKRCQTLHTEPKSIFHFEHTFYWYPTFGDVYSKDIWVRTFSQSPNYIYLCKYNITASIFILKSSIPEIVKTESEQLNSIS